MSPTVARAKTIPIEALDDCTAQVKITPSKIPKKGLLLSWTKKSVTAGTSLSGFITPDIVVSPKKTIPKESSTCPQN